MLGDRLFMVTLDAHLLAFDRATGRVLWDVVLADYKIGYAATMAPLVVDGKVIVGISGGEYPTRGFLDAYDPHTGARIWRFYTVPDPGEPGSETWPASAEVLARGGGGDVDDRHLRSGAEPALLGHRQSRTPITTATDRKGDNLYTNSLLAIDADTGTLKWHYQFTPHDTHDWDSNHVPVLADCAIGGERRKVVMVANRNGFFYVLDRRTGKLLLGKPFTGTTWAREIGADGRPIVAQRRQQGVPSRSVGRHELHAAVLRSARCGLFFVSAREPARPTCRRSR